MRILRYLKALSEPTRLRLFNILMHHEFHVNELVRLLQMGQSRVSRHLKILLESGLLSSRRDGLLVYYTASVTDESEQLVSIVSLSLQNEPQISEDNRRSVDIMQERNRTTQQFFNTIAGNWENLKRDILGDFDLNNDIVEHLVNCNTAADIGCGTGDLLSLLMDKTSHIIGVDSTPGMLEQARRRFTSIQKIDLRLGEAEHLPLRDQEADAAVMNMVLHHLSLPQQGIQEVYRVLKKGNLFILAELAKHNQESARERYGDRWLGFTRDTIYQWLETCCFQIQEEKEFLLKQQLKLIMYIAKKV